MENILSINAVVFTIMDYPMSYIEFFGTIFNLACVWLVARGKIANWPVGIVGIIFYIALFYQIQLYADLLEQFYFLVMSFYGWWLWSKGNGREGYGGKKGLRMAKNDSGENMRYVIISLVATIVLWQMMKNIHLYLPIFFSEPASFPFLDSFTTVLSFAATILMINKKVDSWYYWILVDIIGIGLYFAKDVRFISLEYVIFLAIAIRGLIQWRKEVFSYGQTGNKTRLSLGEVRTVA